MIRTDKRLRLCAVLLTAILLFIWGNSLMPGEISQRISNWVQNLLMDTRPDSTGNPAGNGLLRKLAHFTEFAALGMTLGWFFGMLQKKARVPFLWGVLAACVDETIQAFVPERSPGLGDVLIDSCGVLAGIALVYLGHTYFKKKFNDKSFGGQQHEKDAFYDPGTDSGLRHDRLRRQFRPGDRGRPGPA